MACGGRRGGGNGSGGAFPVGQQVKGKAQNAMGDAKNAVKDAANSAADAVNRKL